MENPLKLIWKMPTLQNKKSGIIWRTVCSCCLLNNEIRLKSVKVIASQQQQRKIRFTLLFSFLTVYMLSFSFLKDNMKENRTLEPKTKRVGKIRYESIQFIWSDKSRNSGNMQTDISKCILLWHCRLDKLKKSQTFFFL